ncbi:alanine/glycine:cation symporter family protein [Robiginitomaculum antarcticum]|uniref:alanine/glycine:cation symporter family protein n=1 Tax=Robiginitomaculum antarcticum TaxID=437507 RepID=UPI00037651B9|nr:sodium:alanine symporter family protein [Robiginitomaculum antarcticum]
MESFENILASIESLIWETSIANLFWENAAQAPVILQFPFIVMLLLGTGLYLTVRLRFMPIWGIPKGFAMLWKGRKAETEEGEVTPFAALATALSSTVGTGNIAGVATAIAIGGPGAIFWMWMTALVGMATKYSESLLAVRYREVDTDGTYKGGPMYYIKNGLGPKWKWLAILFCVGALASAAGAGNMAQGNSIAEVMRTSFGIPNLVTGLILASAAFAIIIGGIKSIGRVASKLVPFMGVGYVLIAIVILAMNIDGVPAAFGAIFDNAFSGRAAAGGFIGATIAQAISFGVNRGLFSNEAGQGSAPIAHAAAQTKDPVQQATIAMLGTFIDTIVICTMTALIILSVTGNYKYSAAATQMKFCETANITSFSNDEIAVAKFKIVDFEALSAAAQAEQIVQRQTITEKLQQCEAAAPEGFVFDDRAYAAMSDFTKLDTDYAWKSDSESSSITAAAFEAGIPYGKYFIAISLLVFAFTTILGWSYYGERSIAYLAGEKSVLPFRIIWCLIVFAGAVLPVQAVWTIGGIGNGIMATPNLIAVLLLSGIVISISRGGKYKRKPEPHDESAHARGEHDVEHGGLND